MIPKDLLAVNDLQIMDLYSDYQVINGFLYFLKDTFCYFSTFIPFYQSTISVWRIVGFGHKNVSIPRSSDWSFYLNVFLQYFLLSWKPVKQSFVPRCEFSKVSFHFSVSVDLQQFWYGQKYFLLYENSYQKQQNKMLLLY